LDFLLPQPRRAIHNPFCVISTYPPVSLLRRPLQHVSFPSARAGPPSHLCNRLGVGVAIFRSPAHVWAGSIRAHPDSLGPWALCSGHRLPEMARWLVKSLVRSARRRETCPEELLAPASDGFFSRLGRAARLAGAAGNERFFSPCVAGLTIAIVWLVLCGRHGTLPRPICEARFHDFPVCILHAWAPRK